MRGQNLREVKVSDLYKAKNRLAAYLKPTPVTSSELLNIFLGGKVYLKLENLQPACSYKIRGAINKCLSLKEEFGDDVSIITASSGNHGLACAYASKLLDMKSKVYVPVSTPQIKKDNIRALGATLVETGETYDSSFISACEEAESSSELNYVHPVSDVDVVAAQGTIGLEILEQLEDAEQVIIPLGGGGLSSGIAFAIKNLKPSVNVISVMPEGSDVYVKSREAGKLVTIENPHSIADAVVRRCGEEYLFPYIEKYVDEIRTVSEDSMMKAIKAAAVYGKVVLEAAGAMPLAAVLEDKSLLDKKTVLICSGGNIDEKLFKGCLNK